MPRQRSVVLDSIQFLGGESLVATLVELLDQAKVQAISLQEERDQAVSDKAAESARIAAIKDKLNEALAI